MKVDIFTLICSITPSVVPAALLIPSPISLFKKKKKLLHFMYITAVITCKTYIVDRVLHTKMRLIKYAAL